MRHHLVIAALLIALSAITATAATSNPAGNGNVPSAGADSAPAGTEKASTSPSPAPAPATGGAPGVSHAPAGHAPTPPGKESAPGAAPPAASAPGKTAPASGKTANGRAKAARPTEIPVARFSHGDLTGWYDKVYSGKTVYTLDNGALKAHAVKSGSGKIKEISVDPKKYPKLSWSWKVAHTLKREDIKKKSGNDFAARVYVIFPRTFFWRMRAINYVWAAKMPKGSEAPSPHAANSAIVAVESGDELAGKWVSEERNVYEDYKRIFGEEPPQIGGVAIMTDTDDTQDEVSAWYGDITLHVP
jgi:hypothetical protein